MSPWDSRALVVAVELMARLAALALGLHFAQYGFLHPKLAMYNVT